MIGCHLNSKTVIVSIQLRTTAPVALLLRVYPPLHVHTTVTSCSSRSTEVRHVFERIHGERVRQVINVVP